MICPSCSESLNSKVKHCTHCGITVSKFSIVLSKSMNNFGWVARRSLGGVFAGGIGWILAAAVTRALQFHATSTVAFDRVLDLFPGKTVLATIIAGSFIGAVGGMIERSTYKSFLGGALGALGGLLGALSHPIFASIFKGQLYQYSLALGGSWAITCAFVGLSSGILEGSKRKIAIGVVGGLVGGALGAGFGSQFYGALLLEMADLARVPWGMGRLIEFSSGGIVGMNVWLFLGMVEKLYIFKRKPMSNPSKKVCDSCKEENTVQSWFCSQCGSALQEAASREQISAPTYRGLERVANAFQFLSWLSATAGVVTALIVFMSFFKEFHFAFFGAILVGLAVYILSNIFKAISETIRMGMTISEKNQRK